MYLCTIKQTSRNEAYMILDYMRTQPHSTLFTVGKTLFPTELFLIAYRNLQLHSTNHYFVSFQDTEIFFSLYP